MARWAKKGASPLVALGGLVALAGCDPIHFVVDTPGDEPNTPATDATYRGSGALDLRAADGTTDQCVGQGSLSTTRDGRVEGAFTCSSVGPLVGVVAGLELTLDGAYGRGTTLSGSVLDVGWPGAQHFDGRLLEGSVELVFQGATSAVDSCEQPVIFTGRVTLAAE